MFLNFIGTGSALNTALGNNSAFVKEGKSMLLIDCGSTTFSRMQELKLLTGVKEIFVLLTHRHPDHIASLGDLIFYAHYIIDANITVLTPDSDNIRTLLKYMGVSQQLYSLVKIDKKFILNNSDISIDISYIPVHHVEDMDCYGYIIKNKSIKLFYSGDSRDIPITVLDLFKKHEIDYIYQDVCSYDYPENPHMYIEKLVELIKEEDRGRVFCMHYDEKFSPRQVLELGFKLVEGFYIN